MMVTIAPHVLCWEMDALKYSMGERACLRRCFFHHHWSSRVNANVEAIRKISSNGGCLEATAAKADVAVGTHEIERGPRYVHSIQFAIVDGILRNIVNT